MHRQPGFAEVALPGARGRLAAAIEFGVCVRATHVCTCNDLR